MKYLFEWTPEISVGDAVIDVQHKRLLGQVNTLLSYITSEKDNAIVADTISFLDKYTGEHFSYEEKYMIEHKYPDLDAHEKLHHDFMEQFKKFKERFNAGVSRENLTLEIEQYIGNWWIDHIGKEDRKYAEFVKTHNA